MMKKRKKMETYLNNKVCQLVSVMLEDTKADVPTDKENQKLYLTRDLNGIFECIHKLTI